ncbi:MAG: IclR family transcriptional regulator [Propionibacteriales bacterium]|nr:IclR family transcriptional regulator [Propionibacteriales bacterium]
MVKTATTINSVSHAVRAIDLLAEQSAPVGLTVISSGLDLPRATTLRVLNTLIAHGYVWKQDKRYALTLRLLELAASLRTGLAVPPALQAALSALVERTGLTVHLAVLDGDRVCYISKVDPPGPLRMASHVGWRGPLHATAVGKILLTQAPAVVASLPHRLERFTDRTITDRQDLDLAVGQAVRVGYAVDDQELNTGLTCVAIAVPGHPRLAVSASGPTSALPDSAIPGIVAELRSCVDAVS